LNSKSWLPSPHKGAIIDPQAICSLEQMVRGHR